MRISLELSKEMKKRLDMHILNKYGSIHGRQQGIIINALNVYLDKYKNAPVSAHPAVETPKPEEIKSAKETLSYGMPTNGQRPTKEPATPKTKVKKQLNGRANVVKLTDEDDRKIRELLASGITNRREIARQIEREKQYETVVRRINKIKKEGME